jgi:excisionase family DNA binding protein
MEKLLLTERETYERLAIGRSTLRLLMTQGHIQPVRIGRSIRFRADDVTAFVKRLGEVGSMAGREA